MGFNKALLSIPEDKWSFILKNGKRQSKLDGFEFESLIYCTYGFIKNELPELIKIGDFEMLILKVFKDRSINLFPPDIDKMGYHDMLHFILWISDEIKLISRMEQEYLSGDSDIDLIAAGIHELNQFGEMNIIDSLAGGDMTKYKQIEAMPYNMIFDKQYKMIIEGIIQKRLAKIKTKTK